MVVFALVNPRLLDLLEYYLADTSTGLDVKRENAAVSQLKGQEPFPSWL